MSTEREGAAVAARMPAFNLRTRHTTEYQEYLDFTESLRGRIEVGPLGEVLSMYPQAVLLALRAADEVESNLRKIEEEMFEIFRRYVSRARDVGQREDGGSGVPGEPDGRRGAVMLTSDPDLLELERLFAEQVEIKRRVFAVIEEFRRRETERRLEAQGFLSSLTTDNPALARLTELRRKMCRADVDYQLTLALYAVDAFVEVPYPKG